MPAARGTAGALLLLLLGSAAISAQAQSIDYTAAEQLFGEPVTTSATGKPQRASEAPADMDIVTADDIRRSGADNIPDVLRFVAGIDVRSYGMEDSSVGIRGYNTALNPRVLVLLDGRQVYQDDYGLTSWPLIPVTLSEIRQIEIIKGPNAALYGFNAVSGVINILTYDPLRDRVNAVRMDAGTQNQAYGEATATAQLPGRIGVRLSASGFRSTEYEGAQAGTVREQPHSGTVAADARVQVAPGVEWDLSGSIGSVDSDLYIDTGTYVPAGFKANSLRSRLSADTVLGILQFDAYRNENRTSNSSFLESTHWREDVSVIQVSDLVKLGLDHTVRVAVEYRDNSLSSLDSFDGREGYTDAAASLMWNWQITPRLSFTNAVRVDDFSLSHDGSQSGIPAGVAGYRGAGIIEPSFNSGVVLKVTDYDTVRLTAARAVQLPSLVDFGFSGAANGAILLGNSGLQPSAVLNFEAGYDRALPALGSTLRFAAFAQNTDTAIGSPFGSGAVLLPNGQPLLMARNFGSSSALGGEVGIKGSSSSGLRWNASYALAAVHDTSPAAELLSAPSVSYQRQTPTHSVIIGGGYTVGKWELDAQARWQSHIQDFRVNFATSVTEPVTVPNYITVNARIAYRLTEQVTLALVAQQLNQQHIAETAGFQTARRLLVSLKARF